MTGVGKSAKRNTHFMGHQIPNGTPQGDLAGICFWNWPILSHSGTAGVEKPLINFFSKIFKFSNFSPEGGFDPRAPRLRSHVPPVGPHTSCKYQPPSTNRNRDISLLRISSALHTVCAQNYYRRSWR